MERKKKIKLFNKWNVTPTRQYKGMNVQPLTCGNDSSHDFLVAFDDEGVIKLGCNNCEYVEDFLSLEFFHNLNLNTITHGAE